MDIYLKIRLALLWSKISVTVVEGISMTLVVAFFFFLINNQSTYFSTELWKQVSRNKMYAHCCQPLGIELWSGHKAELSLNHHIASDIALEMWGQLV